jgi:hypothetical protein
MNQSTLPPSTLDAVASTSPKRRSGLVAFLVLVALAVFVYMTMGVYTIQPIGALPEGRTILVWRGSNEPFFNSADATCLRIQNEVSLMCRLIALGKAPTDRIILRLPYMEWTYKMSTGGKTFES